MKVSVTIADYLSNDIYYNEFVSNSNYSKVIKNIIIFPLLFLHKRKSQSSSRAPPPLSWRAWDEIMIVKCDWLKILERRNSNSSVESDRSFGSHIFCVPTTVFSSHNSSMKSMEMWNAIVFFLTVTRAEKRAVVTFGSETNLCLLVVNKDPVPGWACQGSTLHNYWTTERQNGKKKKTRTVKAWLGTCNVKKTEKEEKNSRKDF